MKVVILCGGLGTRLKEETEYRPKPMVKIGTKPILWHIMKRYSHYGFKDFVLCLGYKGEMITQYFYNYEILNNDFTIELGRHNRVEIHDSYDGIGWRVTLADTGERTFKGTRLKNIKNIIELRTDQIVVGSGIFQGNLIENISFFDKMLTTCNISERR